MPSTTTFRDGQVVVVNVPFTGQSGSKHRPALVVSVEALHGRIPDVIVCPISSQPRFYDHPGPGDVPLRQWRTLGLRYPSTARISNVLAVEKKLIRRIIGTLATDDKARVQQGLRDAFGLG